MNRWPAERLRLVLVGTADPGAPLWPELVREALAGGVTLVQVRGKGLTSGEYLDRIRGLLAVCRPAGVPLVVNDRPDLTLAAGADGAHVGPEDLPPAAARRVLGDLGLGVSVRDEGRLGLAEAAGADYLGVGALRATSSKPDARVVGLDGIAALIARTSIPVVAIGGIRPHDLPALRERGATGVAVGSGILEAADPRAAARAYIQAWGS